MKITIVIPSRLQPIPAGNFAGQWFVERAIGCVRAQTAFAQGHQCEIVVGVDPGMGVDAAQRLGSSAIVAEAPRRLQAAALNASIAKVSGEVCAFLEDDDLWAPDYLALALLALQQHEFCSSTQIETQTDGHIVRILDYATPSGWVMKRTTLQRVGLFDESYRWHVDSEWLGRLVESGLKRTHLVEATAPVSPDAIVEVRPQLGYLLSDGGPAISLSRHASPWPLVMRTVHPGSGMAQIGADPGKRAESDAEYARIRLRYGAIPW